MRKLKHAKGVVALTISSLSYPVYAESPKSDTIYLDCEGSVATIEGGNLSPSGRNIATDLFRLRMSSKSMMKA